jgi:hypothetical protein
VSICPLHPPVRRFIPGRAATRTRQAGTHPASHRSTLLLTLASPSAYPAIHCLLLTLQHTRTHTHSLFPSTLFPPSAHTPHSTPHHVPHHVPYHTAQINPSTVPSRWCLSTVPVPRYSTTEYDTARPKSYHCTAGVPQRKCMRLIYRLLPAA